MYPIQIKVYSRKIRQYVASYTCHNLNDLACVIDSIRDCFSSSKYQISYKHLNKD